MIFNMKKYTAATVLMGLVFHAGLVQAQVPVYPNKNFHWPQLKEMLAADDRLNDGGLEEADFLKVGLLRGLIIGKYDDDSGKHICGPDNISYPQLLNAVRESVKKESQKNMDRTVGNYVFSALSSKYPCGYIAWDADLGPAIWTGEDLKKGIEAYDRVKSGKPLPGDGQIAAEFNGFVLAQTGFYLFRNVCIPPKTTTAQLTDMVSQLTKKDTSYIKFPARDVVRVSLQYGFPCKKQ